MFLGSIERDQWHEMDAAPNKLSPESMSRQEYHRLNLLPKVLKQASSYLAHWHEVFR